MASDNDWADGSELAGMSRSGNVLAQLGYDPDEARGDPAMRAEIMSKLGSPYALNAGNRPQGPASSPATQTVGATAPAPGPRLVTRPTPAPAAATAPPAAASSQVSPSGTSTPAPDPNLPESLSLGLEGVKGALAAGKQASGVATELQNDKGPDTGAIDSRIKAESTPTPYRDPHTGKVLESAKDAGYKPGFWGELGRGVRGAAVGLLTGGASGAVLGALEPQDVKGGTAYGAPDRAYQTTEANRESALASDQAQRTATLANFKDLTDRRKGLANTLRDVATSYNDAAKTGGELTNAASTAANDADEIGKREDKSPQGETALSEARFSELNSQADRMNLTPRMRTQFLANNGKLPDPRQASAEEIARAQALQTFRRQNNREPQTMDEINSINAAASGRLKDEGGEAPPPEVSSAVAASVGKKQQYIDGATRISTGRHVGDYLKPGGNVSDAKDRIPAAEYNQTVDQYRLDLNKAIAKHGWEMDSTGQLRRAGSAAPGAPVALAPPQAAAAPQVPQVSAQASPSGNAPPPPPGASHAVRVGGRITGYVVNGKYQASPGQ
jgi:hypothetical protein